MNSTTEIEGTKIAIMERAMRSCLEEAIVSAVDFLLLVIGIWFSLGDFPFCDFH